MALLFILLTRAEVVELVDALRSGRSGSNPVGVRVPPSAPAQMKLSADCATSCHSKEPQPKWN
jgi:hypothetical protein